MLQWKQRLYAFLLRRVLGPFLDASANRKLHDSIDVSLQDGRIVLKGIGLNAAYLTERLAEAGSNLCIRKATIERLEILLSLRENSLDNQSVNGTTNSSTQSSLAWRTIKLGTMTESLPAVSLIAEIKVHGLQLELEPGTFRTNHPTTTSTSTSTSTTTTTTSSQDKEEALETPEPSSKSMVASYIDAALASLQLTLRLTNVTIKFNQKHEQHAQNSQPTTWVSVVLSSVTCKDLDVAQSHSTTSAANKTILNKTLEISDIAIHTGEQQLNPITQSAQVLRQSTVCMSHGSCKVFLRVMGDTTKEIPKNVQQDIQVDLNHQLNFSVDQNSLLHLQKVATSFSITDISQDTSIDLGSSHISEAQRSKPETAESGADADHEDLKAITGIMKQYREAYHLAEHNQLRGGILVPSHAYMDDFTEEDDQATTFDVFFDANDQSFYKAATAIRESILLQDEEGANHVQTKLRFHLLSSCVKINFQHSSKSPPSRPPEYLLLSINDLNISASSTGRNSELTCNISHLEIEDAQLLNALSGNNRGDHGGVDVGTSLGFATDTSGADEYDNELVVSQAPCITMQLQLSRQIKGPTLVQCDISLLPLEVCLRLRTLSNLSEFASSVAARDKQNIVVAAESGVESDSTKDMQLRFVCSCPSLTLSLPTLRPVSTSRLFERYGERLNGAPAKEASLSLVFDTLDIEAQKGICDETSPGIDSSLRASCICAILFASAPIGDNLSVNSQMQRVDIALLGGRTEVDPYIPVKFEFKKKLESNSDSKFGRDAFPIVPTISSFKARQDDEDEELKIDQLLASKLPGGAEADSRKNLRGKDPQIAMVTDAEKSDAVASLTIPEMILDLTKSELSTVVELLDAAKPCMAENPPDQEKSKTLHSGNTRPQFTGVSLNVDTVTFSLKEDSAPAHSGQDGKFSCLLALDRFKVHALLSDANLKNLRLITHDVGFFSVVHPERDSFTQTPHPDTMQRIASMKTRIRIYKEATVSPVLYRSQLFNPICDGAPSILLDFRDLKDENLVSSQWLTQRQLYLTLYHLTYRYNVDSDWIERVKQIIPNGESKVSKAPANESSSMTRLFVSLADCNIDYTSPTYFDTAVRTILRVGDLRFSSNILQPVSRMQAYSVSLGDFSYNLCNKRLPHLEEDAKLCRAPMILPSNSFLSRKRKSSVLGITAEALLREFGFIEVLGLDSMDAIAATTNWNAPGRQRDPPRDPALTTTLTFGLLSVGACKDSFTCFASSIGELQAKLTALSDDDIERLRVESDSRQTPKKSRRSQQHIATEKPKAATSTKGLDASQQSADFLLDGYEWTGINQLPVNELLIPDGDEQVSGWYQASDTQCPASPTSTLDQTQKIPSKIIHHHFPLQGISNPLSEGDMGAAKHAGENASLSLKMRLLVHKLSVKLRLYDGFDWPEALGDDQKMLIQKNGTFVIEPLMRADMEKVKQAINARAEEALKKEPKITSRKVSILADLLDSNNSEPAASTFSGMPLPEERAATIQQKAELRRLGRKTKLYLQVSLNGVTARMDAYDESKTHRLASVLSVSVSNLFVAETTSHSNPVKMFGEWINENEHPRDTRFGTVMLKMITWKPRNLVTPENEVESDDCEAVVQFLPMRAVIDQRVIHFAQAFFRNDEEAKVSKWSTGLHLIPPPRFQAFRVKPWKLKVDYMPQRMDVSALREGSIVELVNISPIDGMVITLSQVNVEGVVGFGEVINSLSGSWLHEVVSTQLHKFVANSRPFEPITDVGQGLSDLVVLPYEAFRNGDDIQRAMNKGFKSLAETVTFQALTTTSRLTEYAANKMATVVGARYDNSAANPLPIRPTSAPKGMRDVTGHAVESLARGFQAANYKVVIIPYREYSRNGAGSAVTSVLRGIPVMLVAPVTGVTEAVSYTLLGARNALRPDIRKEEEASRTGFTSYDY